MRKKIFPGRKIQSAPHKKTTKKEEANLRVKPARKARLGPKAEMAQTFIGLHNLSAPKGAHKGKKLLGRGPGSGHGKTSTRGSKGQTSRAGRDFYLGFEGGQMPLIRRMPKRGFTCNSRKAYQIVNLEAINKIKEPQITLELLEQKGLIRDKNKLVKILGDGEIKNPVTVWAHAFSKSAFLKIKSAGGKSELVNA